MAYNPGIQYRGDVYLSRGIDQLGEGLAKAITSYKQNKEDSAAADQTFDMMLGLAKEQGYTPNEKVADSLSKFHGGSLSAKKATLGQLAMNIAAHTQRQKEDRQQKLTALQMQELSTRINAQKQADAADAAFGRGMEGAQDVALADSVGSMWQPDWKRRSINPDDIAAAMPREGWSSTGGQRLAEQIARQGAETAAVQPQEYMFGGRKLLINPRSGALISEERPDQVMPEGFIPQGVSVDQDGNMRTTWGPPGSETKALTQSEVQSIAALNQAENDLNAMEAMYKKLGADWGGPVAGRLKSWSHGGNHPDVLALENAITAATPNLARGVFREVGVLTDADIERYKGLLPSPRDTEAVRQNKFMQLRERLKAGREEMMRSLQGAGRDVSGFDGEESANTARYDTAEQAMAAYNAAAAAGQPFPAVVQIYDAKTARYRPARITP